MVVGCGHGLCWMRCLCILTLYHCKCPMASDGRNKFREVYRTCPKYTDTSVRFPTGMVGFCPSLHCDQKAKGPQYCIPQEATPFDSQCWCKEGYCGYPAHLRETALDGWLNCDRLCLARVPGLVCPSYKHKDCSKAGRNTLCDLGFCMCEPNFHYNATTGQCDEGWEPQALEPVKNAKMKYAKEQLRNYEAMSSQMQEQLRRDKREEMQEELRQGDAGKYFQTGLDKADRMVTNDSMVAIPDQETYVTAFNFSIFLAWLTAVGATTIGGVILLRHKFSGSAGNEYQERLVSNAEL